MIRAKSLIIFLLIITSIGVAAGFTIYSNDTPNEPPPLSNDEIMITSRVEAYCYNAFDVPVSACEAYASALVNAAGDYAVACGDTFAGDSDGFALCVDAINERFNIYPE